MQKKAQKIFTWYDMNVFIINNVFGIKKEKLSKSHSMVNTLSAFVLANWRDLIEFFFFFKRIIEYQASNCTWMRVTMMRMQRLIKTFSRFERTNQTNYRRIFEETVEIKINCPISKLFCYVQMNLILEKFLDRITLGYYWEWILANNEKLFTIAMVINFNPEKDLCVVLGVTEK